MVPGIPYPIKKEIKIEDKKIVLLKIPTGTIYNRNVFCLNSQGNIVWRMEELPLYPGNAKDCPYTNIEFKDGKLKLWNWCSFCFVVDPENGNVLERIETR